MDKSKVKKDKEKLNNVKKYEENLEKQRLDEDIEPDITDNPGVTHIPPECINE